MTIINYIVHPLCLLQDDKAATDNLITRLGDYAADNPGRYILEFQDEQTASDLDNDYFNTYGVCPEPRAPYQNRLRNLLSECDTFEGAPDNYSVTGPVHIIGHGTLESSCVKTCVENLVKRLCSEGVDATYEIRSETCLDVDVYTH